MYGSTDELRAAANRIVHRLDHDQYGLSEDVEVNHADVSKIARHVQRMYDETPVSIGFLERLRRADGGDFSFMAVRLCDDGLHLMGVRGRPQNGIDGLHDYVAPNVATQGDVRRLCEALGIELRERE